MSRFRRAALVAICVLIPQVAMPCHVPETLREMQGELTAAQTALLAHGHPGEQIPYHLAAPATCTGGFADIFPCDNVDLLAHMNLSEIGGGSGNDAWGWEDPLGGKEYALVGRSNGTAFVDVSDPENPVYIGNLPTHTGSSSWRDIKVYQDHAFVVSDSNGSHGLQVFDLTQLRSVVSPPVTFSETAHYNQFGSAHNVAINEVSGFAYVVGSSTCGAGLHMVDISNPTAPSFAGCFSSDGYTHDVQCVSYRGPDPDHQGKEICFASNEDTVTIVDVTDKANPAQLARVGYANDGYIHQGWLTPDQTYFVQDDELDEVFFGHNTRTYVWDVSDLDNPTLNGFYQHAGGNIDHNQYISGGYTYQSNYTQGLRIMEVTDPATASLTPAAFFDSYPENDGASFNGSWSNYPFFDSGIVVISDITRGLFIVRPNLAGGGIPCEDIDRFQVRCQSGGRVQYRSLMSDGSHNGETVTFQIDGGSDHTITITNGKAQGQQAGFALGQHTVSLSDPAGCFPDKIVTCN
jgi:choice-of-anchor B domain-containing protein